MSHMHQVALDRLPHQPPFRFLTHLIDLTPHESARGIWVVKGDEWFLKGHFPGMPIIPGVLLTEALAQLAGVIETECGDVSPDLIGKLAHVDVRFKDTVVPPAEVMLDATLTRSLGKLLQYEVRATVAGRPVASGHLVLALESSS